MAATAAASKGSLWTLKTVHNNSILHTTRHSRHNQLIRASSHHLIMTNSNNSICTNSNSTLECHPSLPSRPTLVEGMGWKEWKEALHHLRTDPTGALPDPIPTKCTLNNRRDTTLVTGPHHLGLGQEGRNPPTGNTTNKDPTVITRRLTSGSRPQDSSSTLTPSTRDSNSSPTHLPMPTGTAPIPTMGHRRRLAGKGSTRGILHHPTTPNLSPTVAALRPIRQSPMMLHPSQ